jgi:hypothetical protein
LELKFSAKESRKFACENQELTLTCPSGWDLHIHRANYGRLDPHTCPGGPIKTNECTEPKSLEFMKRKYVTFSLLIDNLYYLYGPSIFSKTKNYKA